MNDKKFAINFIKEKCRKQYPEYSDRAWNKAKIMDPSSIFYALRCKVTYEPRAQFDNVEFTTSVHDEQSSLELETISYTIHKVILKIEDERKDGKNIQCVVGDVIYVNEYKNKASWISKEEPRINTRTTVCLPFNVKENGNGS